MTPISMSLEHWRGSHHRLLSVPVHRSAKSFPYLRFERNANALEYASRCIFADVLICIYSASSRNVRAEPPARVLIFQRVIESLVINPSASFYYTYASTRIVSFSSFKLFTRERLPVYTRFANQHQNWCNNDMINVQLQNVFEKKL